ncbi:MAM and LDL-receptor class A domain-containing protein 2-like [Anneissia japonica]|uniref:MAM and LDL-receptor class A domain-containing protein 2-like n=1 Tax=Anneissia japonica TaxID=1529436 RepID=UPI0014256328|nr:MAM and LDL-receptor class A domain-containing protein 2-like [Anneissia japonica]
MYLETSVYPVVSGHKARIMSPVFNTTSNNCLEFWYNMNGRHSETLKVYIKDPKAPLGSPEWTMSGDHGDRWYRATVSVNPALKSFIAVFEAVRGEGEYGDIALDDVYVHAGACPEIPTPAPPLPRTDVSCTFEVDMCNYTQGIGDKFDWALYNGDGYRSYVLPRVDHTKGTDKGAFVHINPLYSNSIGDDARLVSPLIKMNTDTICLRFFFYINHWSVDKFAIYLVLEGESKPLDPFWAIYNQRSSTWQKQDLEIYPQDSNFYIMFVGTKGSSTYPNIALDDITTTNGPCKVITPTPGLPNADCDFEKNLTLCGYEQDTTDNFDWIWHQGSTGSKNTGPVNDHTIGDSTGHYIYIETSDPRRPSQRAKITSQTIAGRDEPICLNFWYHMKGDHVGTLNVYKLYTGSYRRSIWSKRGNQGKNWKKAMVLINQDYEGSGTYDIVDLSFKIIFEAIVGNGHEGDIALDDITFEVGPCKSEESEEKAIPKSCDFESGAEDCGIYQYIGDEFDWLLINKSDASKYKKYKKYLKNHGSIMALDLDGKKAHARAILRGTIVVKPNTQYCMSLDYIATGDVTQRINILMLKTKTNYYGSIVTKPLKSISGHKDDEWKTAYININPKENNVTYLIEGVAGATDQGRIAIDNIIVNEKPCNETKQEKRQMDEPASFGTGIGIGFLICVLVLVCLLIAVYAFHNRRRGLPRYTKELNTNAIFKGGDHDPDVNFS